MVLIMTPNNYLVILICSTIFLLSSFVSSQQNSKPNEDPIQLYNLAVYYSTYYPQYYAAIYDKLSAEYGRMVRNAKNSNPMNMRAATNNKQSRKDIPPKNAPIRNVVSVSNIYGPSLNPIMGSNYQPRRVETRFKSDKFSRSMNRTENPAIETFMEDLKESPVAEKRDTKLEQEWKQHCYMLGYNNSNNFCRSEERRNEEIAVTPNKETCRKYIEVGCQYRSSQESCNAGINEVLRNITFDCRDINIASGNDMNFQCCLTCKGGINTATLVETCDMHLDGSLPGLAQQFCCEKFLQPKTNESATESIATSEKPMDVVLAMLDERISNSSVNKPVGTDDVTIVATLSSPITTSTVTTTTTTTTTIATTTAGTDISTESPETATSPPPTKPVSTPTTEPTTPSVSTLTTEPTTPSVSTVTTEPTTPSVSTVTTETTSESQPTTPVSTLPTTELQTQTTPTTTVETSPSSLTRNVPSSKQPQPPKGYKLIENQKDLYQKIDIQDKSIADYLIILQEDLKIEKNPYKKFKLMNLTLTSNITCDWEFNFENATADEIEGKTLSESNFDTETETENPSESYFEEKPERSSFIVYLSGKVEPQTVQYSVECNIEKYKYYKYQVYLTFINP